MTRLGGATRALAVGLVLGLACLVALGIYAFRSDFEALRKSTQENIIWSANQLEFELSRFMAALGAYGAGDPLVDSAAVNRRFDNLWSRVAQFDDGETGRRLSAYDGEGWVAALFAELVAQEEAVMALGERDTDAALAILAAFRPHADELRRLSLDVLHGEEANRAQIRENVRGSAAITMALVVVVMLIAAGGMIVLSMQNRRYQRLADANRTLAEEATAANEAKSRFITMMSHELRTPMNGLLGLLALARQPGLPRPQLRLLEQAERSGYEMIAMLGDLLDYGALRDARMTFAAAPFSVAALAEAVRRQVDPVGRREGISLSVEVAPDTPLRLVGDESRLAQAISRLASYIVATAGAKDVRLRLSHDGSSLVACISFTYGAKGGDWTPDLVLGAPERGPDQFASDALGPAVARLVVDGMGGRVWLETGDAGCPAIRLQVPAEPVIETRPRLWIETRSQMIGLICRAALAPANPVYAADGAEDPAEVVIYEAGSEDEAASVAELRARFPGARLIAIGAPRDPSRFDVAVGLPVDQAALRMAALPGGPAAVGAGG